MANLRILAFVQNVQSATLSEILFVTANLTDMDSLQVKSNGFPLPVGKENGSSGTEKKHCFGKNSIEFGRRKKKMPRLKDHEIGRALALLFLERDGWTRDKWGNWQKEVEGRKYRFVLRRDVLRKEVKVLDQWKRLSSAYYKDLFFGPDGSLEGLKR